MPKLYIMCGVGFSGKSTLAKRIAAHTGAVLVSQDQTFFDHEREFNLDLDSDKDWKMVLDMSRARVDEALRAGNSVVFDDTHLRFKTREKIRKLAHDAGAESVVVFLDTPVAVQRERQERNKVSGERHEVKQEYLDEAIRELEPPNADEQPIVVTPDTDIPELLKTL